MVPIEKELQAQWAKWVSEQQPAPIRKREFILIAVFAVLLGWYFLDPGTKQDMKVIAEAQAKSESKDGEKWAALLAACFNGESLTDGQRTIRCLVTK